MNELRMLDLVSKMRETRDATYRTNDLLQQILTVLTGGAANSAPRVAAEDTVMRLQTGNDEEDLVILLADFLRWIGVPSTMFRHSTSPETDLARQYLRGEEQPTPPKSKREEPELRHG